MFDGFYQPNGRKLFRLFLSYARLPKPSSLDERADNRILAMT